MPVVATDISVAFGERRVLNGMSATFEEGTITALRAPSGFGKSTLLAIIAGHQKPDAGTVTITSADGGDDTPGISWIDQASPVFPHRTATDNVAMGALSRGATREESLTIAAHNLTRLGLDDVRDRAGKRLSGGERQRVAVARSMAAETPVILADEPTASLDAASRGLVIDALRAAADAGAIVIIATHDDTVAESADRIIRMDTLDTPSAPEATA
ncbi:ATP-binding cassette domain-containing protein [Mycetocola tolaasinivorans]|uniref:ATP-binding cassette domain-containing protein n=1 Tax=Mycetocola tolaasinivorans TaxID=76635 RepID=A0A3L7A550_9MICO|nr:ATP-binding cassette domain-containing protein [Mycetocola tolaasinivorans]RLP75068.1 ATP-binding cassette domain-containing protein [Mycetocola tolaasinivorans]